MSHIPFQTIDWSAIEKTEHKGEKMKLEKGGTYVVSDELSSHRSVTEKGVKLLIVDGDFLKLD